VLADLSINYVERQVLLCGCSVQRIYSDYGYDLMVSTFKPTGEIQGGQVFFQVKATDSLPLLADKKSIPWVVSRRDLRLWLNEAYPVILAVYDGQRDRAYWLHVQAHFVDRPSVDLFLAGGTINVHLPVSNRLNRRSIQLIVQRKNAIHAAVLGRNTTDV
jgi:hypothetical protein